MVGHRTFRTAALLVAAIASLCSPGLAGSARTPQAGAVDQERLNHAASSPGDWITHGGAYAEQRFSALDQINAANVGKLGLAWSFEFDTNRGQEATPLEIDGVIYVSTAWSKVYAIDARTGRQLWRYDPQVPGGKAVYGCCDVVNRGVAVWKGKVFVGTLDGRLVALNAANGKVAWSVQTTDPARPYTITGAPRVFKDKVIIGNGGAEFGVRGYVTAYDTATGRQRWRFYTVPPVPGAKPDRAASDPVMAKASATWFGTGWHQTGGGGTVWDSIVYDPELDQLYIGVGNGSPWNRKIRSDGKGDNLFLASVVALDPDTGAYRWHYQETPGESYDFTSTQQLTLATLTINGKPRQVLLHAPKNGMFYVIDRASGKLLSAKAYTPVTWNDGVDMATGRPIFAKNAFFEDGMATIFPFSYGAHNWHPMSFSPQTGLVYIPMMQRAIRYGQLPNYAFVEGRQNFGQMIAPAGPDAGPSLSALIAWDPLAQKEVWRAAQPELWVAGALSTAGNIVFNGNAHGEFVAYRATDGARLWSFRQQAGIIAGPITYSVDGVQYVAVMAGYGGGLPLMTYDRNRAPLAQPPGRLLVFRLGGTASIPDIDLGLPPFNPPQEAFPVSNVALGGKLYFSHCIFCHGGSVLPDLRRSAALPDREAWRRIVLDGALASNGMAGFARWLRPEEAEAIRAYVGTEAQGMRATASHVKPLNQSSDTNGSKH